MVIDLEIIKYSLKIIFILIVSNVFYVQTGKDKIPGMIYILLWTHRDMESFGSWNPGRKSFKMMNCEFQNCYITGDEYYLNDLTDFDAILFNVIDVNEIGIPHLRAENQLYVLVSLESKHNYEIGEDYNWFFNFTWTYKLNSDLTYPYMVVRNKQGEVVAPKVDVQWMDTKQMKPTSQAIKDRLQYKKKAVAWFASNCLAVSNRLDFARILRESLANYDLEIDIYGGCGFSYCPREQMDECLILLEREYYFYLSFENSFSEDYVTEKLLIALDHFAVPIVYGGANYTRFMPDGIYLNAVDLGQEELAKQMNELINDKEKYYDYFKWRRYYSYHDVSESADTNRLCAFCAILNNATIRSQRRVYARMFDWWNNSTMENAVVTYDNADPKDKGIIRKQYREPKSSTSTANPLFQNVGKFVDQIYNYYFETDIATD